MLPETLEKQYALHTATRSSVRDLPKYVQADIDKVLQVGELLSPPHPPMNEENGVSDPAKKE